MKTKIIVVFLLLFINSVQAQQTNYPSTVKWVNVKNHGVKGDGVTDDTDIDGLGIDVVIGLIEPA